LNHVFVLAADKQPLTPCSSARARLLLKAGKAAVLRQYPFTIILKGAPSDGVLQPIRFKTDPGSKTTGIALVHEKNGVVLWAGELTHRGQAIKASLDSRRALRRSRRNRKTRYRKARFLNRTKPQGWLAPSLQHRVLTIGTWFNRLRKLAPIASVSQELVRFDTQQMANPEISGVEYQQGELLGYEVREYLLEKFNRQCAYCDAKNVPLQVEHILARAKGGTNRVSNLTLACDPCNDAKGTLNIKVFLAKDPERLKKILARAAAPLKDAAAVNSTRWALFQMFKASGLPVEVGTGGRTKFNRTKQGLPKAHWIDAACVGESGAKLFIEGIEPLLIKATGHGTRQMCGTDAFGFPIRHRSRTKKHFGFETGDIVRADVPKGKHKGVHLGRVTVRARAPFRLGLADIHPKHLQILQQHDGYSYQQGDAAIPPPAKASGSLAA
jgi:5-methylcytosine-specific restriction endonuclease McrA